MIIYQTENVGKHYDFRSNPHTNYVMPAHIHNHSEIAYTLRGTTTVILDGVKYRLPERHLIFISPNRIHEYRAETASDMRCAVFSNDYIPWFAENYHAAVPRDPVLDLTDDDRLFSSLQTLSGNEPLRICGILNLICDKLVRATDFVQTGHSDHRLLEGTLRYVTENFRRDIRLKEIAKELGYHEKYLSSELHAITGLNFRRFLAAYRIENAKHLLRADSPRRMRVAEIAFSCGFSSINSFNRSFLEITGMTPSRYRAMPPESEP